MNWMNNDQRIAEIKARAEAATPGPWKLGEDETIEAESDCIAYRLNTRQDAEFIANARTDIPYLLSQLAERDKELKRLQKELASLAIESIEREKTLVKLEAEVMVWAKAEQEGRLVVLPCKERAEINSPPQ